MRTCDSCRHLHQRQLFRLKDVQSGKSLLVSEGWCHAAPPQIVNGGAGSAWPPVALSAGCGTHMYSLPGFIRAARAFLGISPAIEERLMFEKTISTTFTDPNGAQAEHEKHRQEAVATLGAEAKFINSAVAAIPQREEDTGKEFHLYTLTTTWHQTQ